MSSAALVPETWELKGDDARRTLRDVGRRRLVSDAFGRLRVADGFSHARSLAFMTSIVVVQGLIALVGFASLFGQHGLGEVIVRTIKSAAPGPAGALLTQAVVQAESNGTAHRVPALVFGLVGALVAGTTATGQLERALNRFYGVEQDRPSIRKYGLAFALTITAGTLAVGAFATLALGRAFGDSLDNTAVSHAWNVLRWPLGLGLITAAITLMFRCCPRRRQPGLSWLAFGATISVLLWTAVTVGLAEFFSLSSRSERPTDRWPGWWRSSCGRSCRRSRCSMAPPSPRSSRRSAPGRTSHRTTRRSSDRNPKRSRSRTVTATATGSRSSPV